MSRRRFKGLYLQATGDPCYFSFVTYTPQTREQMLACALVLATGVKSTELFTIHIGTRLPPAELGCVKSGHVQTDEGRRLKVFKCPI